MEQITGKVLSYKTLKAGTTNGKKWEKGLVELETDTEVAKFSTFDKKFIDLIGVRDTFDYEEKEYQGKKFYNIYTKKEVKQPTTPQHKEPMEHKNDSIVVGNKDTLFEAVKLLHSALKSCNDALDIIENELV
jgi:hypothetical protein